jgi:NIPSNAP
MNSAGFDSFSCDGKGGTMTLNRWKAKLWKFNGWSVCGIALAAFAAGSLTTARWMQVDPVSAASDRVFELRVYHAAPDKLPALESNFRDTWSKLLAKHDLQVVGYWVPEGTPAWDNTFVYLLAHFNREEAKKNWDAMRADPAVQKMIKSEQAYKLVEKIDSTYMRPVDFSPMK